MRRIATALCAGAAAAMLAPAAAFAAFGPVTSFGGSGSGNGQLNHPDSVAATNATVYVADTANNRIEYFSPGGTFQGVLPGGPTSPQDVAIAPDGVVAAGPGGVVHWILGVVAIPWSPPGVSAGVAVDPGGTIYVSDSQGGVIRRYNGVGAEVGPPIGSGQLAQPQGLATDAAGAIYVADTGHGRILKMDSGGNVLGQWTMPTYTVVANGTRTNGRIDPRDVAVDGSGRVFAPDAGTHSNLVAILTPAGGLQQVFGSPDSDPGNPCPLRAPWGLGMSPAGTLYVASTGEDRIRSYDEAHAACPFPNFGPGGGVTPSGPDRKRPKIKLSGFPKKCARRNFSFLIRASDDVRLSRLTLFVNRKRVARQRIDKATWSVRVKMPAGRVSRQLPRGSAVRVLIAVQVKDASGKRAAVQRSFRICGAA